MKTPLFEPIGPPLPFGPDAMSPSANDAVMAWQPAQVSRFDALLHEINPDAPRVDIPRLQALAEWLVEQPPAEAQGIMQTRLDRIEWVRAMLADRDWDTAAGTRARAARMLEYLDSDDDLIPDQTPLLGRLDDVLLFDLAWEAFEAETEEYRDFCDYRRDERPTGSGRAQQAAWLRDRLAELAQLQHNARVRDGHYVETRLPPDERFHVVA
ncbi:hypothetical protein [Marilutibacter spongiae]|uniref:DUF1232 domain-containing protein n=1 Tax=Marilutibacter spongiae TaxID=2025720 RepID=A0A7W3TMA8_9GAMM|nr:hypothetical protein [Lysobacter spongiae]MBB1060971.1 hypothetical protein [Lysobacter spongiae]